jgi:hypothetical protein
MLDYQLLHELTIRAFSCEACVLVMTMLTLSLYYLIKAGLPHPSLHIFHIFLIFRNTGLQAFSGWCDGGCWFTVVFTEVVAYVVSGEVVGFTG